MSSAATSPSPFKGFMRELSAILKTEVPLPEILTTPISIPFMANSPERAARKRKNRGLKRAMKRFKRVGRDQRRQEVHLDGTVSRGHATPYALNDQDLVIKPDTWIFGVMQEGAEVKVRGTLTDDNQVMAQSIIILKAPSH